jgi:hypothetical protein
VMRIYLALMLCMFLVVIIMIFCFSSRTFHSLIYERDLTGSLSRLVPGRSSVSAGFACHDYSFTV